MEDILECGCGLDVHKESIVACLLKGTPIAGNKPEKEIQEFGTQIEGFDPTARVVARPTLFLCCHGKHWDLLATDLCGLGTIAQR